MSVAGADADHRAASQSPGHKAGQLLRDGVTVSEFTVVSWSACIKLDRSLDY